MAVGTQVIAHHRGQASIVIDQQQLGRHGIRLEAQKKKPDALDIGGKLRRD